MKAHSIHIMPDGSIEGVQQDSLNLCELGHVTNERASDITWDVGSQQWSAIIRYEFRNSRAEAHQEWFDKRSDAVDWEVAYLNNN